MTDGPSAPPGDSPVGGLQHERTALAWERTAIATMVAGALLGRYAADDGHLAVAVVGLVQAAFGSALLVWSSRHYERRQHHLESGQNPAHPVAVRVVGLATVAGIALAFVLSFLLILA